MKARRGRPLIAVLAACAAVAAPAQAAEPERTLTGISGSYEGAAAPTPPPVPEPAPAPAQAPKAAKLAIGVKGVRPVKRNRWLPVRVTVANVGGKTARGVRLKVKPGRGAAASKRTAKVGKLKPGKTRKIKLRLRTKRNAGVSPVARAGRLTASKRVPLVLRGKVEPPSKEGLGGRWFTSFEVLASGP